MDFTFNCCIPSSRDHTSLFVFECRQFECRQYVDVRSLFTGSMGGKSGKGGKWVGKWVARVGRVGRVASEPPLFTSLVK